jgi:hypothetical protein
MVSGSIHQHFSDLYNAEMQTKIVKFEGYDVAYSYQVWKIRQNSVCNNYQQNPTEFSLCTVKAKDLFRQTCSYLQQDKNKQYITIKLQNMYCNASINFKPHVAMVTEPKKKSTYQKAQKKCNAAILASMGSRDKEVIEARKIACEDLETYSK